MLDTDPPGPLYSLDSPDSLDPPGQDAPPEAGYPTPPPAGLVLVLVLFALAVVANLWAAQELYTDLGVRQACPDGMVRLLDLVPALVWVCGSTAVVLAGVGALVAWRRPRRARLVAVGVLAALSLVVGSFWCVSAAFTVRADHRDPTQGCWSLF